ncbi:MAG: hypothetical protein QGG40_16910 [Myxococcota bacterium]|jgi:hypothetical protein|nr:hypothetical protein [Myxococcota bacterium]
MDWLWPLFREFVLKEAERLELGDSQEALRNLFLATLAGSTATLYAMEPEGDTIRFHGLARWPLAEIPELLVDPNAFLLDRYGGGKFKCNFHHGDSFICTHNFRTYGESTYQELPDRDFS